ncbi:helix-turn-helix transcriptional regulator [Streptomyces sp. NBC_00691]|uniref:helix-turn-helix transcriptional regulator n=1 Tax=Streptomyces sp. NBC_00691 TaxID=2903671 RepID=UPI002E2EF08F|nr:helix-turn-helix transcriptional regulator [Streptomyces sp. NBC_00691]
MRAMTLVWARGRRYTEEAVALAARAVDTAALGRGWWATSAISLLAHAQLLGGDATGCLRTLLGGGGGDGLPQVQPTFRPSLLALMATAALTRGHVEEAERLLADAEADAGRLGLPLQWAPTTLSERGRTAALDVLAQAEALARSCGASLAVEEAARVRDRLAADTRRGGDAGPTAATPAAGLPSTEPRAADFPSPTETPAVDLRSALSEREREIADLAAEGLRSRQIAERLFLSHRTVDSHLGNAYRKLGVTSRTALARALGPAVTG